MKSNEIHILWSDYLHKHPILKQLLSNGFRIFFSMLTLVEDPRIEVAFVENPRVAICPRIEVAFVENPREAIRPRANTFAKHSPQAFVLAHQLLRNIIPH
jgi:hypothetical protein